ncbi:DUF362 domain-containing protein [Pseudodesulfovibrio sediminis]|uniref:DUF362 domain-containing protein n=1 Tax=Pseudodesulfovibrio sediminis TaxID=2810563 RepID=A0ABM8I303_9BACT|nr:DUF362 domain-containing protein [Pseudodesulfovibrio sediminis]BCS88617.1 hypothetical protein PSDVSF_18590 [Pseudodesulfovibrio sediminis]
MSMLYGTMNRRRCVQTILMLGAGLLSGVGMPTPTMAQQQSRVVIVKTENRKVGIKRAMAEFDLAGFKGMPVAIKANYNSADPFPASTHPDTLKAMTQGLKAAGAGPMTLVERSGMGDTAQVLETMQAMDVAKEVGFNVVIMDDLRKEDFIRYSPPGSHWKNGFLLERHFVEAIRVVQTCCLKTHQYGGHFTLSLKNAVGAIAKIDPETGYNYMNELHNSPMQRTLVAEISKVYRNDLIIMDGLEAFVDGGPHKGTKVKPGVIIVSTDPVAVDAVGVAILRMYGTTPEVSRGSVFDQEQIKRAAELGIGARRASDIQLVPIGSDAQEFADRVQAELN